MRGSRRATSRPGRGPSPGLVRVRPPSGRQGWRATARLPAGAVRKLFLDEHHGAPSTGRAAASAWRAAQLRAAGVPDAESSRVVLRARTPSGIVGVYLRPARAGASACWTATYENVDGTRLQRAWSVKQHGPVQALALAIQQREAWEVADPGSAMPKSGVSASENGEYRHRMDAPAPGGPPDGSLSDHVLLTRWLDESYEDAGATSVAVFIRYRELVRTALERAGLAPLDAVKRVGTVFHRAQGHRPDIPANRSLRERLLTVARRRSQLEPVRMKQRGRRKKPSPHRAARSALAGRGTSRCRTLSARTSSGCARIRRIGGMDEKHRVAALLDRRLVGADREAAVSAIVASDNDQELLADAAAVLRDLEISTERRGKRDA
jgi:hypothetical protein